VPIFALDIEVPSIATWQQSQAAWANGVSLASKPRFAS
jgi:hypothetical protein